MLSKASTTLVNTVFLIHNICGVTIGSGMKNESFYKAKQLNSISRQAISFCNSSPPISLLLIYDTLRHGPHALGCNL